MAGCDCSSNAKCLVSFKKKKSGKAEGYQMAAVIQQLRWGSDICNYWLQMFTLSRILLTPFNCWKSLVPVEQELNINACNSHFCQLLRWWSVDETKSIEEWPLHSSRPLITLACSWFSRGGVCPNAQTHLHALAYQPVANEAEVAGPSPPPRLVCSALCQESCSVTRQSVL